MFVLSKGVRDNPKGGIPDSDVQVMGHRVPVEYGVDGCTTEGDGPLVWTENFPDVLEVPDTTELPVVLFHDHTAAGKEFEGRAVAWVRLTEHSHDLYEQGVADLNMEIRYRECVSKRGTGGMGHEEISSFCMVSMCIKERMSGV